VPRWLGVGAVVAKGFARIHRTNLINFGVLPLTFLDPTDYERVQKGDEISLEVGDLEGAIILRDLTRGLSIPLRHDLSPREREILKAGGVMNLIRRGS